MSPPTEERRMSPPTEERPEVSHEAPSKSTALVPTARIVSVTPYKHTRALVVLCPICTRPHEHGLPWSDGDEPDRIGRMHRVSHCRGKFANLAGSYFIEPPDFPVGIEDVVTWGRPFLMTRELAAAS
jgi:hypothetical protein